MRNAHILSGEQTIYQAADLRQWAQECLQQSDALTVDLSGITELDTAGAQVLIWLNHEASRQNKTLHLASPSSCVKELVELLGMQALLPWQEDTQHGS